MSHTFRVTITRKPGIADPEGTTSKRALHDLGFTDATDVSFGRIITVAVDADEESSARTRVEEMCTKLLANPVMEDYVVEAVR